MSDSSYSLADEESYDPSEFHNSSIKEQIQQMQSTKPLPPRQKRSISYKEASDNESECNPTKVARHLPKKPPAPPKPTALKTPSRKAPHELVKLDLTEAKKVELDPEFDAVLVSNTLLHPYEELLLDIQNVRKWLELQTRI